MTSSVKVQAQPSFAEGVKPQTPCYKEGDTVHLKKKKEFDGQVFKKSSVGDIADVQISAISGKVTYTMNMRDAQTWILVDPQDIISHCAKAKHMEASSNQPPKMPENVEQASKTLISPSSDSFSKNCPTQLGPTLLEIRVNCQENFKD